VRNLTTRKAEAAMRVCARANCGVLLLKPDGSTDYKKRFCSKECKTNDLREKMRDKRRVAKDAAQSASVSRNKARSATVATGVEEMVKGVMGA
jgi:endogenous inhibitor of DNA gyrase (YacG/DUF329 family)